MTGTRHAPPLFIGVRCMGAAVKTSGTWLAALCSGVVAVAMLIAVVLPWGACHRPWPRSHKPAAANRTVAPCNSWSNNGLRMGAVGFGSMFRPSQVPRRLAWLASIRILPRSRPVEPAAPNVYWRSPTTYHFTVENGSVTWTGSTKPEVVESAGTGSGSVASGSGGATAWIGNSPTKIEWSKIDRETGQILGGSSWNLQQQANGEWKTLNVVTDCTQAPLHLYRGRHTEHWRRGAGERGQASRGQCHRQLAVVLLDVAMRRRGR